MKFKDYIIELSMKKNTDISYSETKYTFSAEIFMRKGKFFDDDFVYFTFKAEVGKNGWSIEFFDQNDSQEVSPKDKGVSLALFAALGEVLDKFIKNKQPKIIIYAAKTTDTTRVKLYDGITKRISKKYGYDEKPATNVSGQKVYTLEKK